MPVSVIGEICVVQQSPELDLADARSQRLLEPGDAMFSNRHRPANTVYLVGRLDYPSWLTDQHAINDLKSSAQERSGDAGIYVLHCNPAVIGADLFKIIHDIIGQLLGIFGKALGPIEK